MKHAYIFSEEGLTTGILGWILQQSPSYESNFFRFDYTGRGRTLARHTDPWDNHSHDHNHWSHAYIENIEKGNSDFTWLNAYLDSFPIRTIFGLSYGAWNKRSPWINDKVDLILVESTALTFELFFDTYHRRSMTVDDVIESIDMHIHDHHQDNPEYREHLFTVFGNAAIEQAKQSNLEFWQLQYFFHHRGDRLLSMDEVEVMKAELRHDLLDNNHSFKEKNKHAIVVDIFNLQLPELCQQLNIVYSENMQAEYNKFLNFYKMILDDKPHTYL